MSTHGICAYLTGERSEGRQFMGLCAYVLVMEMRTELSTCTLTQTEVRDQ